MHRSNELSLARQHLVEAETELQEGKSALVTMKDGLMSLHDHDKAMEKNFKKEFTSLNYNQLELLLKSYK